MHVALALLVAAALTPAAALAQEGAGGLGDPAPGREAAPTEQLDPQTGPSEDAPIGEVPPPPEATPPSAYDDTAPRSEGRYPSASQSLGLSEGVRIPSRTATRLRVLDADFNALAARGGNALVDGILSILTGGLAITLGIVVDHELLSPYLYVYGGAGVVRGILDLTLVPNTSDAAIHFAHMPMGTMAEVNARLEYGEEELESIANRTRLARILDASINILVGVAIVPLYLGPRNFEVDVFGTFVLIGAGISVVSGVINLLSRSEAERRWEAYSELSERLEREEGGETASADRGLELSWGAMPLPGGGAFALGAAF
jgi:hypothetical protein